MYSSGRVLLPGGKHKFYEDILHWALWSQFESFTHTRTSLQSLGGTPQLDVGNFNDYGAMGMGGASNVAHELWGCML